MKEEIESFCPSTRQQWRKWLQKNHNKKQSVWLIQYKKSSGISTISWSDAVDEALCYGWVDSKRKTIDKDKFMQFFSQRKKNSTWSKINKEKIIRLTKAELMSPAGLATIETAIQNGSWTILDKVEELMIPKDLEKEFKAHPGSKVFFKSLSKSLRKMILQWIELAKRPETRQKRIIEIATLAAQKQKPKQFS
ncbi:MAG: hypothetical protein HOP08_19705 [Cyclobacteriaceae bacterium]|nr:hypothetical protein [Cyclobacteriaceae bacterium]